MALAKRRERQNRAVFGRMRSHVWRQMTGSPLPRKGLAMLHENESDETAFEATSCNDIRLEDPGDRVPSSIKGIARERLLDFFPGVCRLHVSGTTGVEASCPRALAMPYMKHTMSGIEPQKSVEHLPGLVSTSSSTVPAPWSCCVTSGVQRGEKIRNIKGKSRSL